MIICDSCGNELSKRPKRLANTSFDLCADCSKLYKKAMHNMSKKQLAEKKALQKEFKGNNG